MLTSPLIFYADDDQDDLELFEEAASSLWVKIRLFSEPGEMLEEINKDIAHPAIIFVDLNMPMISGYDVIRILRTNNITTPIVVLSTSAAHKNIEDAYDVGANYYITKLTSISKLKSAIEYTLGINWETFKPSLKEFTHLR